MPTTEMKRHPLAVAEDAWLDSPEGLKCADGYTLPSNPQSAREFLVNRLRLAFEAGWEAREAQNDRRE